MISLTKVGYGFAAALVASAISTGAAFAGGSVNGGSVKDDYFGPAPGTKAFVLFSGFDMVEDASYSFQGLVVALNRDIGKDGFLLRLYGSHTDYEYDTVGVPGGRVDGDAWQGDAMIGYKISRGNIWAAAYIGVDYQDHDLTPDDTANPVRGSEVGFKVAADVASLREGSPLYFSLGGQYSTAFDSYWARGRVGLNRGHMTFGPEFIAMGNDAFDAQRAGGFVMFDVNLVPNMPIEVTLSGGYQFLDDSSGTTFGGGGEGAYGGITFVTLF
jgi:hypothetical protein